jgi:hypothetical protein
MVVNLFILGAAETFIYACLFVEDIDITGSLLLCNFSGCINIIGAAIYLSANLLYSLDRYYRIVKFKELTVSFMFAIFFGMLSLAFLMIILTFTRGSRSMTPMGSQVIEK